MRKRLYKFVNRMKLFVGIFSKAL